MIKKIDIYIIKKFLGTFFFSIVLIISIAIVFDLSEKLDDFIEKKVPISEILFKYYANFAPYYANLFMFLFVFIAVIFFTSKMASQSEIIAILCAGVSFGRLMRPYFISAFVLAVFSFVLSNFIIPHATAVRLDFEDHYLKGIYYNQERNIHKQISPGIFLYIENYNTTSDIAYKFSVEKFENKRLVSKLISDYAQWDTTVNKWKVTNYYIRTIIDSTQKVERGIKLDTSLNILPEDFKQRLTRIETLNYWELNDFIAAQRLHGADNINTFLIEKYRRIVYPLATFILTLIGISLSSRKLRGGIGLHIGLGLLLSFSFILVMQISTQFSINSTMPPLVSIWIPNILYLIVGLILYRSAPK